VDHPLPPPDLLVRPWRVAAIVAASIAAVELLVLLAIGGGELAQAVSSRVQVAAKEHALAPAKHERKPAAGKRNSAKPQVAKLARGKTVVLVLNGNGRTGAAAEAASRVMREGYRVGAVGNAPRTDFQRTFVMFKPGFAGEGRRLARDLGVGRAGPLDGMRVKDLGRAHAVVILGA
jgi:LytR cell envelope-related transcriptional attenuator